MAVVLLVSIALSVVVRAQSAESLYTTALAREAELREELALAPQLRSQPPGAATAALLRRIRGAIANYEGIVRRYPNSGYSDNALWQAGVLAADAFWQFGDTRDRATALRLFAHLVSEYPSSSLIARVPDQTGRLNATQAPMSTLKAIRREVLPGAVRMTLELERETLFSEERLEGPPRVYVDLQNTQAVDALKEATLPFSDNVVQRARVGRQADNRTRVVFDLQGAGRYSVYSLYNPYRIVIDFERTGASAAAANDAPGAAWTPAPVAPSPAAPPAAAAANTGGGFSLSRQLGLGVARVVIDPGHGGHDPGAQVRGLTEADLVLDVALRLEKLLAAEPGVEVLLTRRSNAYVPLEDRTAVANRASADLFLSIHANASAIASVNGFETYFLNFAPNREAEAIAARENAGSARTMSHLPDIVKAIALNNKINESRDFATMVQASMHERLRQGNRSVRNLGVKQAPFMVLIGATMPSVLAEVAFLTNRQEAALLRTQSYRQQLAEALFAG
ncbi:MAG: N-acetylmuramoyl-L-alanine amidase, partial [Acidobacteria bacterium]|nr:N-acetylmuramoyl-L-alanine amidase [Acidobacteriota bacterium]